jgi:hypothetical protein
VALLVSGLLAVVWRQGLPHAIGRAAEHLDAPEPGLGVEGVDVENHRAAALGKATQSHLLGATLRGDPKSDCGRIVR